MQYDNYEDYMKSVLGYPLDNQNTYEQNYYNESRDYDLEKNEYVCELEKMYPDLYKKLNPIIVDICTKYNQNITRDILEDMVEEIYKKIENDKEIMINVNIVNNIEETNKSQNSTNMHKTQYNRNWAQNIQEENRQRRPSNSLLRDLIKILILNNILGNRPNRPPKPKPPFPGHGRPPIPPRPNYLREYDDYLRF